VESRDMTTDNKEQETEIIFANCDKRLECDENYTDRCKLFHPTSSKSHHGRNLRQLTQKRLELFTFLAAFLSGNIRKSLETYPFVAQISGASEMVVHTVHVMWLGLQSEQELLPVPNGFCVKL
jgi:hypothetical protein